jgi:hypothetical protein
MTQKIVLISCVSQKLSHRAQAKDLYISTLFKLNRKYAEKLNPDKIFVLSAKYGLLDMTQEIEPYEQTLNNMPVKEVGLWANRVVEQLQEIGSLNEIEFTFLAGEKYRKFIIPHLTNYKIPLQGLTIGRQLQKLKQLIL